MSIEIGDKWPEAELVTMGAAGPETVDLARFLAGRKVVLFALPGAYTGPCSTAPLPSKLRVRPRSWTKWSPKKGRSLMAGLRKPEYMMDLVNCMALLQTHQRMHKQMINRLIPVPTRSMHLRRNMMPLRHGA